MAALLELEQILRSKQEKLSSQEANVLMTCKANAIRDFSIGVGAGGAIAWLATRKLPNIFRTSLAGGVAFGTGFWTFGKSLDSCTEQILCMDGSRMQKELANIMLRKYPDNPMTTKLVSKSFYCENVLDDSTSDTPRSRWRLRNTFFENAAHTERTDGHEYGDPDVNIDEGRKPVSVNNGFVALENPFDCVFGVPPSIEEIQNPVSSTKSPRSHSRKYRRSKHRHQKQEL